MPAASDRSDPFSPPQAAPVLRISEPESPEPPESTDGRQGGDKFIEIDVDHSPEDRTPTLDTIVVPPLEKHERLPPQMVAPSDEEQLFQKALTVAPPPSPPPSPPTPTTVAPPASPLPEASSTTILGLLSTPPKRPSFHSSRLEFQTPSPPHGLPELPGPPSSSDEETETERPTATPLRFNGASDMSSVKTPRPPGAWTSTPTPAARAHSLPPPEHDDSDSQHGSGLATPVASLSRASSFPAQTPKPPGGWVATPTPRKSILKVRFNPQPSEFELSATEDFSSTDGRPEESSQLAATGLATPVEEEDDSFRTHTPESPTAPVSPSKSPRRSPTIRVVDEYGRPDKSNPIKSPKNRNKNPVRIVDAMGRELETVEPTVKNESSILNHNEALRVVREGVRDLVQGFDEMDISGDFVSLDEDRLRELDNASRTAREVRDGLKHVYHNDRTAQLRANMQRSKSSSEMSRQFDSRSPLVRVWLWTFIIISQALFIFLLYQCVLP
ncbi:hypothetical protein B0H11DRAFT_604154 [Mycena galericulata]|nr:hypothetical protein B0H11DRAFT_604154 [Mycena galericulata]